MLETELTLGGVMVARLRKDNSGIAVIEAVLVLLIVAIIGFVGWYVYNSKQKANTSLQNASNASSSPAPSPKQKTKTSASKIITIKTTSGLGDYLADGSGKTLYQYGADKKNTSNCTGSCLTLWPIYQATRTKALPKNVAVLKRSDGTFQYTYKGLPLYYFAGEQAGQVTGNGVSDFHIVKP